MDANGNDLTPIGSFSATDLAGIYLSQYIGLGLITLFILAMCGLFAMYMESMDDYDKGEPL